MGLSITSANAQFTLVIPGVYSSGILLAQFATDDMFEADPQEFVESRTGADGVFVGGYVFNMSKMRINFQANSPSIGVFYAWKAAQDAQRDIIVASATIISPALGMDVTLPQGHFTSAPLLPPHKKVAEPLSVELTWGPNWQNTQLG
jgi:hypothetical protein